jgi:hypothetical protein
MSITNRADRETFPRMQEGASLHMHLDLSDHMEEITSVPSDQREANLGTGMARPAIAFIARKPRTHRRSVNRRRYCIGRGRPPAEALMVS